MEEKQAVNGSKEETTTTVDEEGTGEEASVKAQEFEEAGEKTWGLRNGRWKSKKSG